MKEKYIKSTLILLVGGFATKLLGMLIKIIMARTITTESMGLYMLILPTFSLLISLSQFGFPIALSKLISEDKRNNKKLFFSILPILILINVVLIFLLIIIAPLLSNNLLHNRDAYISIIAISTVLPFTTISSLCRSYFFGKERMVPHITSNIVEDFVRLFFIYLILPHITFLETKYIVCFLVLINIISESASTLILIAFLPKKLKITKEDLKPEKTYIKESLRISVPTTSTRLIGSIGFFLEPIILTHVLIKEGYTISFITKEYGILSGYVMPLLLLPSFFTFAFSQALLPVVSKDYSNHNIKGAKRKVLIAITLSLLIGIPTTLLFFFQPKFFLKTIYQTTKGANYVKVLAMFFLFQYIQSPLATTLDAIGKSKENLKITIIGTLTRTISLYVLSTFKIGIWSLIFSTILNITITSLLEIKTTRKYLTT